ncbi:MAG: hypothetical protein WBF79_14675 [Rhodococcus sp. (in: high G+C Gram-positive bacteria)]
MPDNCAPTFADLAARLGFSCADIGGVVDVRSPLEAENWTLPVLEILVTIGAVVTLAYAVRRLRQLGDPTTLVVWFGSLAYLFLIEPPLYFPAAFGLDGVVDTMFAHNLFTVEFLWGRLPLYIVAIYPMMATTAFEIVRALGVFRRRGPLIGAVCVGFVHHAFYEFFDHLGPQLRWWEWTLDHPVNQPFFASVPIPSVVVFAALWPMSLALCAQYLVGRPVESGRTFTGAGLVLRIAAVGIAASIGTAVLPLPATLGGYLSGSTTVGGAVYVAELAVMSMVAVPVLMVEWSRLRRTHTSGRSVRSPLFAYAALYLTVMTVLWVSALPAALGATDGVSAAGDPVGNLPYAAGCLLIAALVLAAAVSIAAPRVPIGAGQDSATPSSPSDRQPSVEGRRL